MSMYVIVWEQHEATNGLKCGVNVVLKPGLAFECLVIKVTENENRKGFAVSKLHILFEGGKKLW